MLKDFTNWQDRVLEDTLDKDPFLVSCLKAVGVGALEGIILGCSVVGALYITGNAIKTVMK